MAVMTTHSEPTVTEMRLVVTADDYDDALGFYRDVLGLPTIAVFDSPRGRVTLLGAGRATLELTDRANAAYVDEVEVGRRVAGLIRVAFEVLDTEVMTRRVAVAGATVLAGPTPTPWGSLN
jgi:lactoylglutathione lyase